MENSALLWGADHARHHARVDQEEDPYNAKRGFWYSHCGWIFLKDPHRTEQYAPWLREDPVVMWQHRWYVPIVLSGLALSFMVGFVGRRMAERAWVLSCWPESSASFWC